MPQPDFLIIGVPESGTTAVCHYLQQHLQIFMAPSKEPHCFQFDGQETPPMNGPFDKPRRKETTGSWDAYRSLFNAAGQAQVAGGRR